MGILATITSFEFQVAYYLFSLVASLAASFFALRSLSVAHRRSQAVLIGGALFICITCAISGWHVARGLVAVPKVKASEPLGGQALVGYKPEITVTFATPIDFRTIAVHTYPEAALTVLGKGYFGNRFPVGRIITVVPESTFPPGEPVMVYFSNVEGPFTHGYGGEHLLELTSPKLPNVVQIEPSNTDVIAANAVFTVHLDKPSGPQSEWSVQTDPPHEFVVQKTGDTTLSLIAKKPLRHGVQYKMDVVQTPMVMKYESGEVVERGNPRIEKTFSFKTIQSPFIKTFAPLGESIDPSSDLRIEFDQPMVIKSVEEGIRINPTTTMRPAWQDNGKTLLLTHPVFPHDTKYTFTLSKSIISTSAGKLEKDVVFDFETAGAIAVGRTVPSSDATNVATSTKIRVTFDQDIATQSALNAFSIVPKAAGKAIIEAQTFVFTPESSLSPNTKYTVKFAKGMNGTYGLPSDADQTFSFTTGQNQVVLNVPFYKQDSPFSCNIAAAKMLLAYKGIAVTEKNILDKIGSSGKRGSGNPHTSYIDDYGTYWEPVVRAVSEYRPARLITSGKLADIITEIKSGNPVMIWGQNGWSDPHDMSWTATDGTFIKAINGMHSSVVRGFRGSDENPTHILLNDSLRGQYAIDTKEFLRRWSFLLIAMVLD